MVGRLHINVNGMFHLELCKCLMDVCTYVDKVLGVQVQNTFGKIRICSVVMVTMSITSTGFH